MKAYYVLGLTAALLGACSKGNQSDLAGKKEQLAELKSQQAELATQIRQLETEVAKLDPKKGQQIRVKDVTAAPVAASTFRHFVEVQGTIDAKNNIQVTPKAGGAITALYVKEGDAVRPGSVIARLDDAVLQQNAEQLKTQLTLATTVYEKQANLWRQQIGTEVQFLQAKTNKEALERQLATLNTQRSQFTVTSPIGGVVDKVNVKIGDVAMPGMGMARVVNLSQLKVIAKVADTYVGNVKKGDEVIVRFPDVNKELRTRINFVSTTVDPASRTFTIEAPLPSSNDLKPNMLAQVKINDVSKPNAVVIDQNLIQNTEQGQLVYVAANEGGKRVAKARLVKTGLSYGGQVEVTEGLQAGDQLIKSGYQELVDGQPINF